MITLNHIIITYYMRIQQDRHVSLHHWLHHWLHGVLHGQYINITSIITWFITCEITCYITWVYSLVTSITWEINHYNNDNMTLYMRYYTNDDIELYIYNMKDFNKLAWWSQAQITCFITWIHITLYATHPWLHPGLHADYMMHWRRVPCDHLHEITSDYMATALITTYYMLHNRCSEHITCLITWIYSILHVSLQQISILYASLHGLTRFTWDMHPWASHLVEVWLPGVELVDCVSAQGWETLGVFKRTCLADCSHCWCM
jgi:hypothetical protein